MIWIALIILLTVSLTVLLFTASSFFFRIVLVRSGIKNTKSEDENQNETAENLEHKKKIAIGTEWIELQKPQNVSIQSDDALTLRGYYIPCENAIRTVVCVHGYRGDAKSCFCTAAKFLHDNSCSLLLINQRSHGTSDGKYICFGVRERYDLKSWIVFLNLKYGVHIPVYLYGVSMGAATVLMASNIGLPENVRGIIADCGYTSPWEMFEYMLKNSFKLPVYPLLPIVNAAAKLRAGFDFKVSSSEAVKNTNIPILFIHGSDDNFVPRTMSEKNYELCASDKKLLIVDKAAHALSYLTDTNLCEKNILEFMSNHP